MDDELRDLTRRAAGPPPTRGPDIAAIRRRGSRRRLATNLGAGGAVAIVTVAMLTFVARPPSPPPLDVTGTGFETTNLVSVETPLDDRHSPRLLPAGYLEVSSTPGSTDTADGVVYCGDTSDGCSAGQLMLQYGRHDLLPETGDQFTLGDRVAWIDTADGTTTLTVSDRTSADDVHYRLSTTDPDVSVGDLAAIVSSIPAYVRAASTTG